MNAHGALMLSEITGCRTFQVVEYATREVRETLKLAADGAVVRVWLEPLSSRGDAWRVVAIDGGVETRPGDSKLLHQPVTH